MARALLSADGRTVRQVLPELEGQGSYETLDRVFLGVHFPSDVTVGVLTGVGLAVASYAGYSGWNPPEPTEMHDPDADSDPRSPAATTSTER